MRDDFDNLRAERETPYLAVAANADKHAGLWKQIAIGIVVGHLSLALIGAVVWMVAAQLLVGDLQIVAPWAGKQG
ncbi:hypothetical protein [Stutzerimonas stutzeri]|jgi:hypothetical protein|uniref:Uncharacterized protein n=1 Tax=Stutzerimonas stutzeri TaxID=316 RepID=A0A172WKR2_STUST|nr:hypothetical protein [Stutzerimonas stutzeri]ANF24042.1 hypothetical protein PS273GM_02205 [Stutzerimonas stutzeri]MCQ4285328.1 hypothetical protein [Stutzerimonas stutzeri]BAP78545.1 hypothetical protein MT1_1368 [Pseudomonas sp. MT-1]HAB63225.1 hypothetical protein [Pseudomonas sp.]